MTDTSRRAFLATAGSTMAGAWLVTDMTRILAAGRYAAWAGQQNPLPPFQYLSVEDGADVEAAASVIIPSDDTPGAREARVVYFIDKALATGDKDDRDDFRKGIRELRRRAVTHGARTFVALTEAQRVSVIAGLEKDRHPFFFDIRGMTITGMLANPEYGGNHEKTGWKMIGFVDQFSWAPPFGWYDANER